MPLVGSTSSSSSSKGAGSSSNSGSILGKAVALMRQLPDLERLLARCVAFGLVVMASH